mmetsp:Transcript_7749/g.11077  ORF Transcript_7749/g.11077 Transcript_7749/m.11077 type:complete len:463 (+) Transcript_7749:31-1419(+)
MTHETIKDNQVFSSMNEEYYYLDGSKLNHNHKHDKRLASASQLCDGSMVFGNTQKPAENSSFDPCLMFPPDLSSTRYANFDCKHERISGITNHDDDVNSNYVNVCTTLMFLLRGVKGVLIRITNAYFDCPFTLSLMPLLLGLGIGIWIGRTSNSNSNSNSNRTSNRMSFIGNENGNSKSNHDNINETVNANENAQMYTLDQDDNRDDCTRKSLQSSKDTTRISSVPLSNVPKHVAVIMDGNRRYGRSKYGNATRGHWDGSKTLIEFTKWCIAEGVQALTVYAFSTENWNRHPAEVAALMKIFSTYCEELRLEALQRGIRINVLSTEQDKMSNDILDQIHKMVQDTMHCENFIMNICLSYGSRGEIVNACKQIATCVSQNQLSINEITEHLLEQRLLTWSTGVGDPDVIIRTSGEMRLSNFLLWQSAYSELFFVNKQWPELLKEDLINVIQSYASGRKRRFGK